MVEIWLIFDGFDPFLKFLKIIPNRRSIFSAKRAGKKRTIKNSIIHEELYKIRYGSHQIYLRCAEKTISGRWYLFMFWIPPVSFKLTINRIHPPGKMWFWIVEYKGIFSESRTLQALMNIGLFLIGFWKLPALPTPHSGVWNGQKPRINKFSKIQDNKIPISQTMQ